MSLTEIKMGCYPSRMEPDSTSSLSEKSVMRLLIILFFIALAALVPIRAYAEEASPTEILDRAWSPPAGSSVTASADAISYTFGGRTRRTKLKLTFKATEKTRKAVFEIVSAREEDRNVFISLAERSGNSWKTTRWLYKASGKKLKKLDDKDADDIFSDTGFSFRNLDRRYDAWDVYSILGKPVVDGVNCYLIEASVDPAIDKKAGIVRHWVRVEDMAHVQTARFDKKWRLKETLSAGNFAKVGEVVVAGKWSVQKSDEKEPAVMNLSDIKTGVEIDDSVFDPASHGKQK
jgi:hypothetical protein